MSILSVARVGLSKVGPGIMKGLRGWGSGIKEAFKGANSGGLFGPVKGVAAGVWNAVSTPIKAPFKALDRFGEKGRVASGAATVGKGTLGAGAVVGGSELASKGLSAGADGIAEQFRPQDQAQEGSRYATAQPEASQAGAPQAGAPPADGLVAEGSGAQSAAPSDGQVVSATGVPGTVSEKTGLTEFGQVPTGDPEKDLAENGSPSNPEAHSVEEDGYVSTSKDVRSLNEDSRFVKFMSGSNEFGDRGDAKREAGAEDMATRAADRRGDGFSFDPDQAASLAESGAAGGPLTPDREAALRGQDGPDKEMEVER